MNRERIATGLLGLACFLLLVYTHAISLDGQPLMAAVLWLMFWAVNHQGRLRERREREPARKGHL